MVELTLSLSGYTIEDIGVELKYYVLEESFGKTKYPPRKMKMILRLMTVWLMLLLMGTSQDLS